MKDDSLSDVAFCNTKEGMHARAKELGINAYSLGCSCSACNEGFKKMIDSLSDVAQPTNYIVVDKSGRELTGAEYDQLFGDVHQKTHYCSMCDCLYDDNSAHSCLAFPFATEADIMGKQENVYAKQIWNDAIEAAAKEAEGATYDVALEIRKLKK